MALFEIKKFDKKECVEEFIKISIEDYGKYSLNGELDKYHIRGMAWKIFLEVLPESETEQWVEILDKLRQEFKLKSKSMNINNSGDNTSNTNNTDNDTKKLINLDLDKTFQEYEIFHQSKVKSNLSDILFIWNKENSYLGYQQGMNVILALLFLALYPCYFQNSKKLSKNEIIQLTSSLDASMDNAGDIYDFFNDEDELYSDLYYCFSKLMKRGMKELLETIKINNKNIESNREYQIFTEKHSDDLNNPALIIKEKMKFLELDLDQHSKKIGLSCFFRRWLKCKFDREFQLKDIFLLWDYIFANPELPNLYELLFIDFNALLIIIIIRKQCIDFYKNKSFMMPLFKYPNFEKIDNNDMYIEIDFTR